MAGDNDVLPPPPKLEPNCNSFLGSQDRPGDFITLVRLRLDNFDDWAHAIRVALASRHKFRFHDGTITNLIPPCTTDEWVTIYCMLVSWLMNTIDPEHRRQTQPQHLSRNHPHPSPLLRCLVLVLNNGRL